MQFSVSLSERVPGTFEIDINIEVDRFCRRCLLDMQLDQASY
jgi:hypothetical protein